ncbi:ABC transporter permease [Alicyclobacillus cycloheptanicus]|uniref:Lysophospholipase L1 biosynthesis ABC-type transport system permease subunit n=1 Tax=Alicyclobacillus cycloheptanicus TaxID=1457 RepID=A0ABT9XIA2_9BACL|nr:ABC transporter permease [Alicyclobacillus cycloheptanicus]MDQ0190031.1 putative lysophospholipase L1 biosynthesis ABC-type transport system permease subunit [Alicyclobacillus cycloheptanicus]WDM00067.1 ABC transporter permease [Alicyclobacillus cycloheptanicus]
MTWTRLTLKNGFRSAHRYVNYITASAFSVMVFYMFSAFVMNPAVKQGYMTSTAKELLGACQYIIIVFAVFFIFFFHSALLRLRSKEFGLFITLGVTPRQIGRMIMVESLALGLVATGVGLLLGIVFSKLFLLALGAVLGLSQELPFVVPASAVLLTVIFFGIVFLCEAIWISFRIKRRSPRMLLLGQRVQQKIPKFSWWLVVLGIVCLALGYYLALAKSRGVVVLMLPILTLTAIGTYLLFSQVLVMVLTSLRKRPLNGTTLLVVSRLAYRLKDNARVLTVVSMLTAIVLTGMGAVSGFEQTLTLNSIRVEPLNFMVAQNQATANQSLVEQVRQSLTENHLPVKSEVRATVVVGEVQNAKGEWMSVQVMPGTTFEHLRQVLGENEPALRSDLQDIPAISNGQAVLLTPYPLVVPSNLANLHSKLSIGNTTLPVSVISQMDTRVINEQPSVLPDFELILSDHDFNQMALSAPTSARWSIQGFMIADWKHSQNALQQLDTVVPPAERKFISATVSGYQETLQLVSVMLFAGFFISILFFLAAGGFIYFRIDAAQEEDRKQFRVLQRLGMSRRELGKVLTVEFLLLFFGPVAVAVAHSVVAVLDFRHLVPLGPGAWTDFWAVVGIYCVLTLLYFGVSRMKHLNRVASEG